MSKEVSENFLPIFCPTCKRKIGEIRSGESRYFCDHCRKKVRVAFFSKDRMPQAVIYLVIEIEPAGALPTEGD